MHMKPERVLIPVSGPGRAKQLHLTQEVHCGRWQGGGQGLRERA